jgi:anaerobic selenocysteine-containing dehydrogenase
MSFHQSPYSDSPDDIPRCVLIWGGNYAQAAPAFYKLLLSFMKRGTKLIIVEPRRSELAKKADIWLQLRPATDTALALGILHVIIGEGLHDKDFVDRWCYGFDELSERVEEYTPEKVSEITWVPKEKIIDAARMYALNKPAVITWGVATDMIGKNSTQAVRARCILRAVTGNLDIPCGERMGRTGDLNKIVWSSDLEQVEKLKPEQRKKQLGSDRFKLLTFPGWELRAKPYQKLYGHLPPLYPTCIANAISAWDAILTGKPYPVKGLILQGHNALVAGPNANKIYKALNTVDFSVSMDFWMTPTAALADYLLPAADWLERSTCIYGGSGDPGNFIVAGERAVEPLYERKTDFELWRGLAKRFHYDWPYGDSSADLYDYRLKPIGLTYKDVVERYALFGPSEYKKYEKKGFATPTGKVELYSTIMEKLGYDPLPGYEEPGESPVSTPELAKDYPLILATGMRFIHMEHSQHRNINSLRKAHPDPLVLLHPETAGKHNIQDGEWVDIETVRGKCRMKSKITEDVHPNVVTTEHGWWFPEDPGQEPDLFGVWKSNNSTLTSDELEHCDQPCGSWYNRGLLCKISRAMSG